MSSLYQIALEQSIKLLSWDEFEEYMIYIRIDHAPYVVAYYSLEAILHDPYRSWFDKMMKSSLKMMIMISTKIRLIDEEATQLILNDFNPGYNRNGLINTPINNGFRNLYHESQMRRYSGFIERYPSRFGTGDMIASRSAQRGVIGLSTNFVDI